MLAPEERDIGKSLALTEDTLRYGLTLALGNHPDIVIVGEARNGQEALAQHFARGVPPIALWEGISRRPGVPNRFTSPVEKDGKL